MRPPKPSSMPSSRPFCRRVKANPSRGAAAVVAPVVATVVSGAYNGGTVVSMMISGKCAKGSSPPWITAISQLFGGAVLLVTARLMCEKFLTFTPMRAVVFLYICAASVVGYTLFYYVQRTAHMSNLLCFTATPAPRGTMM